jgi:predicted NAD/FAD-dependent oxidoreductase
MTLESLDSGVGCVAVIGAGMAGLACARVLHAAGLRVTVFERSSTVGGRVATRRVNGLAFDHGAQYVRVRDESFGAYLNFAEQTGAVAPWRPCLEAYNRDQCAEWLVGTPGMQSLVLPLAAGLDIRCRAPICGLGKTSDEHWLVHTNAGQTAGPFEAIAVAIPAPEAAELLEDVPLLGTALAPVVMAPCWSAMIALAQPLGTWPDLVMPTRGPIAWAARDSSKPARSLDSERWVLHARSDWTEHNLDEQQQWVAQDLLVEFARLSGALPPVQHLAAHCWKYARVIRPLGTTCLWDAGQRIGACGDWCIDARVEAAWQSGTALGHAIASVM